MKKVSYLLSAGLIAASLQLSSCGKKAEEKQNDPTNNAPKEQNDANSKEVKDQAPKMDWNATFSGSEELGKNAGGTPVTAYYAIEIKDGMAKFSADGYQTMKRIEFTTNEKEGNLELLFDKFGEDEMFPNEAYKKGDILITLKAEGEKIMATFADDMFLLSGKKELEFAKDKPEQ